MQDQNPNRQIVMNQIRTPDGTVIRSMHRHDYVTHLDKNGKEYMVDGGQDYLRRNFHSDAPHEELTVYSDDPFELIRENLCRGGRGKDGTQPLTWVPLSKMSDEWIKACIEYNHLRGMGSSFANEFYQRELDFRKENGIHIED
jgi:hypothetical protein